MNNFNKNKINYLPLSSLLVLTSFYSIQSLADEKPICVKDGLAIACGSGAKAIVRSVAFGWNADASAADAVAIGSESKAVKQFAVAVGNGANASGSNSLAIGVGAKASEYLSLAIGEGAKSSGKDSSAIGAYAETGVNGEGIAIGTHAKAMGHRSMALGRWSEADKEYSIALGHGSKTLDGFGSIAIGYNSKVETIDKYNAEYGNSKKINLNALNKSYARESSSTATASSSVTNPTKTLSKTPEELEQIYGKTYAATAFGMHSSSHALTASAYGTYSTALGRYSTALGSSSTAVDEDSTAVGNRSLAYAKESTAVGPYAKSVAKSSVALGFMSFADRNNTVSVGDSSTNLHRQIVNVADGTEDYDAVNVRQLNVVEAKIGGIGNQFTNINNHLDRVDTRMNRVGASAAALASLKPANLGVDDKFAVSVGVGNYKNTQAMAVGAVFKPSENVLLNLSGSMSGSEKMLGAGISWKFSNKHKPNLSTQSTVDSAEVLQLRQEISMMRTQQMETTKNLHKQAELESELKQLRRELLELKKSLGK